MKVQWHVSPNDVDPSNIYKQFKYIMRRAVGLKQADDVEWLDDDVGPVLTSPDGSKYRLTVANDGTLSTESV